MYNVHPLIHPIALQECWYYKYIALVAHPWTDFNTFKLFSREASHELLHPTSMYFCSSQLRRPQRSASFGLEHRGLVFSSSLFSPRLPIHPFPALPLPPPRRELHLYSALCHWAYPHSLRHPYRHRWVMVAEFTIYLNYWDTKKNGKHSWLHYLLLNKLRLYFWATT